MASAQQIAANRANAQLSTGPTNTTRTKLNGLSHGMTSRQTVIPGESQAEYDEFHAGLVNQMAPVSETEKLLADRIAVAAWRLRRFTRIEAAFFNNRIDAYLEIHPDLDADAALANLFCDPAEAAKMRLFLRYQTAIQREYDTARRMLGKAREERAQQEFMQAAQQQAQARAAENREEENEAQPEEMNEPFQQIGFASQNVSHHLAEPGARLTKAAA
jgi:hypothetical protein